MDKREALEIYLKLHEECVRRGCKDCIFKEPYNGRKICILLFTYNNSVAESVKAKLKDMKEKQEESSTPPQNVGTATIDDNINRPKHYCKGGVESIDFVKAAVSNLSGFEAVCVANIIKYMWRYKEKNGLEDVMKAAKYLEWLQEEVGKNANKA